MHIALLGAHFAPELVGVAPFNAGLAEHWAQLGHRVTVLTTFPNYPQYEWQEPVTHWRSLEVRGGIEVRRSWVFLPRRRARTVTRLAYDFSFMPSLQMNSFQVRAPDLVIAVSPPIQIGVVGWSLKQRWDVPLLLLVKDLPLDLALELRMLSRGIMSRLGRALERFVYSRCDRIVVINDRFQSSLMDQGVGAERLEVIPDWASSQPPQNAASLAEARRILGAGTEDIVALHAGNMGEKQGLLNVIDGAAALGNSGRVRVVLMGDGSHRSLLEEAITTRRLEWVRLIPLQPRLCLPSLLAAADMFIVNQRADVRSSVVPSKLLSYMSAGRPIVAAVSEESAAGALVRTARCGLMVPPESPAALAGAIRRLAADRSLRESLGAAGRVFAEARFDKGKILTRWDDLAAEVVSAHLRQ